MRVVRVPAVAALVATAVLATVAVAATAPGSQPQAAATARGATVSPYAAVVESAAVPAALRGVATGLTPLVADFDGDARSDVFFYGPGDLPDHLWLGRPGGQFHGVPITVRGTFHPIVGDFNGDRRADVFWYAAGDAGDQVWFGGAAGNFSSRSVTVTGSYEPLPGDFDGNGRTDILWYGPGAGRDVLWLAGDGGRFRGVATAVGGAYRPIIGDFDADRRADVFWYGPGKAYDVVWYGGRGGDFTSRAAKVGGYYEPVVGDFDGDRARDVLWFGSGDKFDALWYGSAARRFAGVNVSVPQVGVPVAADYDGDGRRDVFVYDTGGADAVHYGRAARGFDMLSRSAGAGYLPIAGDFNGGNLDDVLWYHPGNKRDVISSSIGRTFVNRYTTVDIGFTRSPALRPDLMRNQFGTYGYIAHAMGGIAGQRYTNSVDAFHDNYARGFRVFEADQVILRDGTVFVAHDGTERHYGFSRRFSDLTWNDVQGAKWHGRFSSLRAEDLVALMKQHPDTYFILDFKVEAPRALEKYVRLTNGDPALMDRLIPHVADPAMLVAMRRVYPLQNYIVALYRTQWNNRMDDPELLKWVRRDRVPAVMMWHGQRDFTRTLAENNSDHRRYDAKLISGLRATGAVTYVHTVDDATRLAWFADRRIGVYTNFGSPPASPSPTASPTTLVPTPTLTPSETPSPTESPAPTESPTATESGAEPTPTASEPPPAPAYDYGDFEGDEG
ncbi:MAG TPA: FG-GAP-like repeat-containing protein [Frankiaceae bacterium]|nr:FG-GAP-like repeat-containing protein [Frankiaceae bacterium]